MSDVVITTPDTHEMQESHSNPTNITGDLKELFTIAYNSWQGFFLRFFQDLLQSIPNATVLSNPKDLSFQKAISGAVNNLNTCILAKRNEQHPQGFISCDFCHDIDFVDLVIDNTPTRVTNPTVYDMLPFVCVKETTFFEYMDGMREAAKAIPIMAIYPSSRALYRTTKSLKKYYPGDARKSIHGSDIDTSSRVEISITSVSTDLLRICEDFNFDNRSLGTSGMATLSAVVNKYTDFILPIIAINLRVDADLSEGLSMMIYEFILKEYTASIYFQKKLFECIEALIRSGIGFPLIKAFGIQKVISTIQLLNPNNIYATLLYETLAKTCNVEQLNNHKSYIDAVNVVTIVNSEKIAEERGALMMVVRRVMCFIITALITEGQVSRNSAQTYKSKAINLLEDIKQHLSSVGDTDSLMTDYFFELRNAIVKHGDNMFYIVKNIAGAKTSSVPITRHANDGQVASQKVYDDQYITGAYSFIGKSSVTNESTTVEIQKDAIEVAKDILNTKNSFAACKEISYRTTNIQCYEDALGILLDVKAYRDILAHSTARTLSEEDAKNAEYFDLVLKRVETVIDKTINPVTT